MWYGLPGNVLIPSKISLYCTVISSRDVRGCWGLGGSLRFVPLKEVDVFDVNTTTIHNDILWSLLLLQDYDQSMFCDLFA